MAEYAYQDGAYLSQVIYRDVQTADGTAASTPNQPAGTIVTSYSYDVLGRMTAMTDANGYTTQYTYDVLGNLTGVVNPDGTRTSYARDYVNNILTYSDENNNKTRYTYTPLGLPQDVIDVQTGNILSRREYDSMSRLIRLTDYVYGSVTEYTYDVYGNVNSETVLQGNDVLARTTWVYNEPTADGQYLRNTKTVHGNSSTPDIVTTEYRDIYGNVAKTGRIIDGTEYFDTYTYDFQGTVLSVLWAADAVKNLPFTEKYEYNYNNQVTKHTNAAGQVITNTYDAFDRLVQTADYAGTPTTYTYDSLGRLLTKSVVVNPGDIVTTKYEYDPAGNLTRERWPVIDYGESTPFWSERRYVYGSRNQRLETVELYDWDALAATTTYTYDPTGKLTLVDNGRYQTRYTYDDAGRLVQVVENEMDGTYLQYSKSYAYDLNDNRTGFILEMDGGFSQNVSYTYDNLNRLSTVSEDDQLQAAYTYDTNGNRATLTYANGVVESYTYNKANWVTSVTNRLGDTVLSSYAYTYYPTGNQKTKTDHTGKTTNYVYDGLGRLEQEYDNAGLNICYFYDASHNRHFITYKNGSENYELYYYYDDNNQLTEERKRQDGKYTTVATYTYDGNGNQLTKTTDDGTAEFVYNVFNQQTQYSLGPVTVQYVYNADGIRTSKTVNGERTTFLLDGGNVVGEVRDNQVFTTYLRGINLISQNGLYYYLYNAHGDVVGLTAWNGTVDRSYEYSAFGIEENPNAEDLNPFRYCGEYFDNETGTYYLRARYYDPTIGRFTQPDSWAGDSSNPLSLNRYTYCYNSPIRYIDPTGHLSKDIIQKCIRESILSFLAATNLVEKTQKGEIPEFFDTFGFFRDKNGIYHARQDAPQKIFGYNSLYDFLFDCGTSMLADNFEFSADNRKYVIWVWKGDYLNLGAGAELGIYSNKSKNSAGQSITSPIPGHWLVDTDLAMTMTLTLNNSDGTQIFSYAPTEKQWWITGFNPYLQNVKANNLTAVYSVTFNDKAMYDAFYQAYGNPNSLNADSRWSFYSKTRTATLIF